MAFRTAFTKAHLLDGDTAVTAGTFMKVGEYKVQAGEMVSMGFGQQSGQQNAQGRIFADLKNGATTPVDLNGTIRFSVYSAQDRPLEIISEYRTETLRTDVSDRTLQVPLPEDDLWISEDKKLVLEFQSDTSDTVTAANSTVIIDMTQAVV
jgi:uncharacterized protein YneR